MRKAVRHALESASYDPPFLCLLVLPQWDDTPWRSADILSHECIEILASLPPYHMKFASEEACPELPSANPTPSSWPVDFVLVANRKGRDKWLDIHKLQTIFVPALRLHCAVPDHHIELFPTLKHRADPPLTPPQPPPRPPRTLPPTPMSPHTHPMTSNAPTATTPLSCWERNPCLIKCRPFVLPNRPLHVVEICAGIASGIEAILKT